MIINNILDGEEKLTGIEYFIKFQGGNLNGHLQNLRYTEAHPKTPFNITVVGQPVTFTASLENVTPETVCVTVSWGGKGLKLSKSLHEAGAK